MFEDFWLSVKLPKLPDGKTEQALFWPTTQKCVTGQWNWVTTPDSNEAESASVGPAPAVVMYGDVYGMLGVNKTGNAVTSGAENQKVSSVISLVGVLGGVLAFFF